MKLADFVRTLHSRCGKGMNAPEFLVQLVDMIMEEPPTMLDAAMSENDKYNPLAALSLDYLGKICNGNKELSLKAASAIMTHLDKTRFEDWLDETLSFDAGGGLCADLRLFGVNADPSDVAHVCAERFAEIIAVCAKPAPKKKPVKSAKGTGKYEVAPYDLFACEKLMAKDDYTLIMENGGRCPNNCGKPLTFASDTDSIKDFVATRIDDKLPPTVDNLIALCPDCAKKYVLNLAADKVNRLAAIKTRISQEYSAPDASYEEPIEPEIRLVLEKLTTSNIKRQDIKLNMNHVETPKKIYPEFGLLLDEIMLKVFMYYDTVETMLKDLDAERIPNRPTFTAIASEFRATYCRELKKGYPQDVIFDAIVNWLDGKTHVNKKACAVVTAYFVENCEVFDEIAQ